MATPIPPQVTPDEHIATLVALADDYERFADDVEARNTNARQLRVVTEWRKLAAAIRWILEETAHGVDAEELAG